MAFNTKKSHSIVLFNICLSIFLACISFAPTKVVAQRTDTLAISPNDDASISNRSEMVNSNFVNTPFERLSGWTGNNVGSNEQDWRAL
ncbi:MAG: hypothetical protein K2Q22_05540, partial [Cytophagales bacterium]|nr:hypothetical protein [Cytophagales bacterium]